MTVTTEKKVDKTLDGSDGSNSHHSRITLLAPPQLCGMSFCRSNPDGAHRHSRKVQRPPLHLRASWRRSLWVTVHSLWWQVWGRKDGREEGVLHTVPVRNVKTDWALIMFSHYLDILTDDKIFLWEGSDREDEGLGMGDNKGSLQVLGCSRRALKGPTAFILTV